MKEKSKGSIKNKVLFYSIGTSTAIMMISFSLYYYFFHHQSTSFVQERLINLASTAALFIDAEEHNLLTSRDDEQSYPYLTIREKLEEFKRSNSDIKHIYTMRKTAGNNTWEYVVAADENPKHIGDHYDASSQDEMAEAFNAPLAEKKFKRDERGTFLSGYAPIKNQAGETVAIVGIDIKAETIKTLTLELLIWGLIIFLLSLGFVVYTSIKLANRFVSPILEIKSGVERFHQGEWDYRITKDTNDELDDIRDALNNAADIIVSNQRALEKDLERVKLEKEQIFKIYRDVIHAITQGKCNLITTEEVINHLAEGESLGAIKIEVPADVNRSRQLITEILEQKQYFHVNNLHVLLCASEAATNALKHAGKGKLEIKKNSSALRIIVSDEGPGMDMNNLPKIIFLKGFSTAASMGYGFSAIYKCADKIYLNTSNQGTNLIMDF